jgi:single-stranded-DNA-specific exonuclease
LSEHTELVLSPEDALPLERVDAIVGGDELGMTLAEELQRLAPFGNGNRGVSLMIAEACFRDGRAMGEGKHVRFTVESRGARARAVAFGGGAALPVAEGEPAEATFTLEVNEWGGVSEPRLVLRQARPVEERIEVRSLRAEPERAERARELAQGPAEPPARNVAQGPAQAEDEQRELVLFALP